MSSYLHAFQLALANGEVRDGLLYLWGQRAPETVVDLRDLVEQLETAIGQAIASRPKSEQELEQEREAAEAFASFEEDCVILAELLSEGGLISAHPDPVGLAGRYGFDVDRAKLFTTLDWIEAIVSPLSVESRDDSPDCNCQHCPEAGEHGIGTEIVHRVILCTGGPHHELQWPKGEPEAAVFVSLPWFGRVEMEASDAMIQLARVLESEDEDWGLFDE